MATQATTPTFKPGDLIKAASGRIYKVEKALKNGQIKGREQKKGAEELTGPMRTFKSENVTMVEGRTASPKKKAARKRVKPGEDKKSQRTKAGAASKVDESKPKKSGCLDAAVRVLGKSKEPMGCKALMDAILEKKLWMTDGATPHQTLSSAIQREISKRGKQSRFIKAGRGLYTLNKIVITSGSEA